jgi:formate-dependent nitrite reductase cytochrome c552 subunit
MRTTQRENIQLFIGTVFALMLVAFLQSSAHAAIKKIDCQTAFGEKQFTIESNSIAFHNSEETGRSISSTLEAQTQKTHTGFRKTLYINGNKHMIHIADTSKMNDSDDFLAVTNPKGHKMTYPLTCQVQ